MRIIYNKPVKKVRCWNIGDGNDIAYYVGAYSPAHAARLLTQLDDSLDARRLKTYGSECWGSAMEGITPEVGVWFKTPRWSGKIARATLKDLS